jgi:hypothetical protein
MGAFDQKGEGGKAMAMGIRVAGDKEGKRDEAGNGVGNEGGATKRAMALAERAMATRVAGD